MILAYSQEIYVYLLVKPLL
eukprot:gene17400-22949_t